MGQLSRIKLAAWVLLVARTLTRQACLAPRLAIWKLKLKSSVSCVTAINWRSWRTWCPPDTRCIRKRCTYPTGFSLDAIVVGLRSHFRSGVASPTLASLISVPVSNGHSQTFAPYRPPRVGTTPFSPLSAGRKRPTLPSGRRGCVRCPMSERGEETFTMISGLAVFAALCIAALLWLG